MVRQMISAAAESKNLKGEHSDISKFPLPIKLGTKGENIGIGLKTLIL